jgi:hypothetical protein
VRCKKFETARREEEEYPHGSSTNEQRDSSPKDLSASGRGYYDAIYLAVGPDVLLAEPPSKVARPVPSLAAEENPTSADWAPRDSGGKVDHENITLRFR